MPTFQELSSAFLFRELGTADSTVLFTDARRQQAVIDGQREFARLTRCFVRQSSISCSNGVGEYDLLSTGILSSGDFVAVAPQGPEYRVVSSNSTAVGSTTHVAGVEDFPEWTVQRLNQYEPGWRTSTGAPLPIAWYLRADGGQRFVGLYPPPTIQSSETGTLLLPYIARPSTTYSSGSQPWSTGSSPRTDLTDYHQAIVHYAASQLEKFRRDREAQDRQMQLFLGYVTAYFDAMRPSQGTQVIQTRSYFRHATRQHDRTLDPRRY